MKKLIVYILSVIFWTSTSYAQNITVELPELPTPGATITVPLTVTAIDASVLTFQVYVQYDPAVLTYNATLYPNAQFPQIEWVAGASGNEWGANWFGADFLPETITPPAVLCEIEFTYNGGDTPLTWGLADGGAPVKGQTLFFDEFFNTFTQTLVDGCVAGACPSPSTSWTGAVSSDWYDGGNWDNGVPDELTNVTIPSGTPNDPQVIYDGFSAALCNDVMIEAGAQLIVGPDGYLSVAGMCTNDGFLGVVSDADFNGSFICNSYAGTGEYNYWRYLGVTPQPDPEAQGWHYMSSPVQSFGSHNMLDYFINTWDETAGGWVQHGSTTPCVPAPEIFMTGMQGWSVKFDDNYAGQGCPNPGTGEVVEFAGDFNVGDQTATISYTAAKGPFSGFNLVGNPYPSWWHYDNFYFGVNWPAGLNDAIYYWDESANQYASYVFGVGNNGGTWLVPPGQAFFFELDGSIPTVDLIFTTDEQVHAIGPYYKDDATDLVQLQVNANSYTDQTSIKFNENATVNRDKMDARKLFSGGSAVPSLWTLADDIELSINQMPSQDEVPVYFSCATSGTYSIEAVETSEYTILILEDTFTGEETDLLSSGYTFEHTSGASADRFVLHYKSTGIGDNELTNVSIWSGDQKIYVRTDVNANGDITVYNMMGQEVVRTDIEPGLSTIPMYDANTYYVVKLTTSKGVKTGKVFIK